LFDDTPLHTIRLFLLSFVVHHIGIHFRTFMLALVNNPLGWSLCLVVGEVKVFPRIASSQNNLSNGGSSAVKALNNPKQSYVYSPLGQTFCISYREKVKYLLNFSSFPKRRYSKILFVFKRFRVESFV
jgi:hypothetical protein